MVYDGKTKYKWKSRVAKKTLAPVFNQDFTFDLAEMDVQDVVLKLFVKDEDVLTKDDFIGMVDFGVSVDHPTGCAHWRDMLSSPYTRITRWHSLDQHTGGFFQFLYSMAMKQIST